MNKTTLIDFLNEGVNEVVAFAYASPAEAFYFKPAENVWSAAENVQHLSQSVQPLNRLFGRPKTYFLEKWGPAAHPSRSYEEVVGAYHAALNGRQGAAGAFAPLTPTPDAVALASEFKQDYLSLIVHLSEWDEQELEGHVIPHPLMGPLTVREMLLFTAYHIRHHHQIMVSRVNLAPQF